MSTIGGLTGNGDFILRIKITCVWNSRISFTFTFFGLGGVAV